MSRSRTLQNRLSFLGYDKRCRENLKALEPLLAPALDDLLEDFYHFMRERPETRELLPTLEVAMRAWEAQREHLLELLEGGEWDEARYQRMIQIGRTHERMGLGLGTYLGGYCILLNRFVELIAVKHGLGGQALADGISSVQKAMFLDIDLIIESYLEAKNTTIRKVLQNAERFIAEIEQIDAELTALGQDIGPKAESFAQGMESCREQLARLQAMLPRGAEGQALLAQLRRLQATFASCEESAQVIVEESTALSQQLDWFSTEVAERKNRPRLNFSASQPQSLLSRLKATARTLFPS